MTKNDFQLEKNRDFGALFNDTFLFIKHNFKNLLLGMIYFVIPFALLQGIALGIVQHQTLSSMSLEQQANPFNGNFVTIMLVTYFFLIITYTFSMAFIFQYIKLFKASEDKVIELKQVWKLILGVVPKIFAASILIAIISGFATILLVIPGIYLMVCFSLVIPIIIFQGDSIKEAINACFPLIKNNWWSTFGFLIVLSMIAGALQFAFQVPMAIYQFITAFHMAQNEPLETSQGLSILFSIIQSTGASLMQVIPFTGIAILYFSLIEQKQNPALLKELESVGENE